MLEPRMRRVGQLGGAPYRCILMIQGGAWQSEIPNAILSDQLTSPGLNCLALDSSSLPSQQISPKTVSSLLVWYLKKASCSTEYSISIFPNFGFILSFIFSRTIFEPSRSLKGSRSLLIPVAQMNSGNLNMGLRMPRLVCRNFDFWFQCLGTGMVFFSVFSQQRKSGSGAVMSHASTRSGRLALAFRSATFSHLIFFFCDLDIFSSVFPGAAFSPSSSLPFSSISSAFSSSNTSQYFLAFS